MYKIAIIALLALLVIYQTSQGNAQTESELQTMLQDAERHFRNGDYQTAGKIYNDILKIVPNNVHVLNMYGISLSNIDQHRASLKQFYTVLEDNPNDFTAILGTGLGFGNLGEYHESQKYFAKAVQQKPDSVVANNYNEFVNKVLAKYPYTPTQKPIDTQSVKLDAPKWVAQNTNWWTQGLITDKEFVTMMEYLINKDIVKIPPTHKNTNIQSDIPAWVKSNATSWANDTQNKENFITAIHYLIENDIIKTDIIESPQDKERKFNNFDRYLRNIESNIKKEIRYIEYPNPSGDVIKKFLRDYVKWNFEQEILIPETFPDPVYGTIDGKYEIHYYIYTNEQPTGLPLDHVSTLDDSLTFWENQEIIVQNNAAKVKFIHTNDKEIANVWVTWVVRDLGERVLGHANVGKGVVEVALGDYSCDGNFQLYSVDVVKRIMTHEIGHSIGFGHANDPNNIMYPTMEASYAYCLL